MLPKCALTRAALQVRLHRRLSVCLSVSWKRRRIHRESDVEMIPALSEEAALAPCCLLPTCSRDLHVVLKAPTATCASRVHITCRPQHARAASTSRADRNMREPRPHHVPHQKCTITGSSSSSGTSHRGTSPAAPASACLCTFCAIIAVLTLTAVRAADAALEKRPEACVDHARAH